MKLVVEYKESILTNKLTGATTTIRTYFIGDKAYTEQEYNDYLRHNGKISKEVK